MASNQEFEAVYKFHSKSVKLLTFGYRFLKNFFFIPYFEIYINRTRYVNVSKKTLTFSHNWPQSKKFEAMHKF